MSQQIFTREEFDSRLAIHLDSTKKLAAIRAAIRAGVSDEKLGPLVRSVLKDASAISDDANEIDTLAPTSK